MKAFRRTISSILLFFFTLRVSRWLLTSFFLSKKVAVGTRNSSIWFPTWLTVDLQGADITLNLSQHERLPFDNDSKSIVYSSHMIEHISPETLKFFLRESYRILEKGGIIRLEAPDPVKIIEAYKTGNHGFFKDMIKDAEYIDSTKGGTGIYLQEHIQFIGTISCYVENDAHVPVIASKEEIDKNLDIMSDQEFGAWAVSLQTPEQLSTHGHQNPVNYEIVSGLLIGIGFEKISEKAIGESDIDGFRAGRRTIERPERAFLSFYIEAFK